MQPIPSYNKTNPISTYFAVKNNPVAFLTSLSQEGHPIIKFSILGFSYYLVNEPELVQEALVKNPEALIIKGGASAGLARLIGHGILTNRGSNWRKSRTSLQPLFSQKAMEAAVPDTLTCIQEGFEHWQSKYMDRAFCLNRELLALSFRIKAVTLFKYDPSLEEAEHFADAVWTLQTEGVKRYMTGIDYLPWLPLKINKKVNAAITELFTLAKRICKTNPDYPADEITSLLFAGAESPANTLVWVMHMLKENPKWLDYLKQPQNIPDSLSEA